MVNVRHELVAGKAKIQQAIGAAEQGTSGEVVVVASQRAGEYGREDAIFSFMVALAVLTGVWLALQGIDQGSWETLHVRIPLAYVLLSLIGGYTLGQFLAWRFPKIATVFVSKQALQRRAEIAAAFAFQKYRVSKTERNTGVLIFIADVEQTVVVIGDDLVADRIGSKQWEAIRDAILAGIRAGDPVKGVVGGLELTGNLLREHLSADPEDVNERSDRLYFC